MSHHFLLELGTEEIPAGYLAPAARALAEGLRKLLADRFLTVGDVYTTYTPRRLTVFAAEVADRQQDRSEEVQGPPARVAFDQEGKPTRAAEGFARANGLTPADLVVKEGRGATYVFATRHVAGRTTVEILGQGLPALIGSLPFPKSMHWNRAEFTFARPIRSVLALFGAEIVPLALDGIRAGRTTAGHPFLAPGSIEIPEADYEDYRKKLKQAFVIVDVAERRQLTHDHVVSILATHGGKLERPELLEEVTNLVEFPCAVEGSFDPAFLKLPDEVIVTAMTEHQRYFPVRDAEGKLLPKFVTVINRSAEHAPEIVRGNERVLAARLNDAAFFWKEDRHTPLAEKVAKLDAVTFQEKLGSYGDRTRRLEKLGVFLAEQLDAPPEVRQKVQRAAHLAKADLVTHMVFEFPSLQGVMGREYAKADGEDPLVAAAIAEHYRPRTASDDPPASLVGAFVALADKFDALVGCFAAGLIPTGSQDPYALRRQTLGIVNILTRHHLHLSLGRAIEHELTLLPPEVDRSSSVTDAVLSFMRDRLYNDFLDAGAPHELIRAALGPGFDDVLDLDRRLASLIELARTPDWTRLAIAVERTHNITRDFTPVGPVDEALLTEPEERELFRRYQSVRERIGELTDRRDYLAVGKLYEETFAAPLHTFFEKVYVNVEDEAVRRNRLTLLKLINALYADRVADLSQVPRKE